VVLDGHMLYPDLVAAVSGVAHAHSLQVKDVDLDEVAGCQLLKPGPVPSPLHFAWFHQSPSLISLMMLTAIPLMYHVTIVVMAYSDRVI